MITKKQFKEKYEVNGYIDFLKIHNEFNQVEDDLEKNLADLHWISSTFEYMQDVFEVARLYTNDVERDINIRKRNKEQFGIQDKKAWAEWVEKAARFKDELNDVRLYSEELLNILRRQKSNLIKENNSKLDNTKQSTTSNMKRVLLVTLHDGKDYYSLALTSEKQSLSSNDEILLVIDKYLSDQKVKSNLVNFRTFSVDNDWQVSFAKSVDLDRLANV